MTAWKVSAVLVPHSFISFCLCFGEGDWIRGQQSVFQIKAAKVCGASRCVTHHLIDNTDIVPNITHTHTHTNLFTMFFTVLMARSGAVKFLS